MLPTDARLSHAGQTSPSGDAAFPSISSNGPLHECGGVRAFDQRYAPLFAAVKPAGRDITSSFHITLQADPALSAAMDILPHDRSDENRLPENMDDRTPARPW